MSTISAINEKMAAAVAAVDDGDYETALRRAIAAQGLLSVLPSGGKDGKAGASLEWSQEGINNFIATLERQNKNSANADASGQAGMTSAKFTTVAVTD